MLKKVAILVDGDFFIRRHKSYFKKFKKSNHYKPSSEELAKALHNHCLKHIDKNKEELYRIFFYDCKPLDNKAHNPKSNECIDFATTEIYKERIELYKCLISKPCLALRLGYLDEKSATWIIKNKKKHKKLLSGKITIKDLSDNDYMYYAKQKGVDMKIGIDIATLALKKLVQKIVLISGDSDFVPASKLARTEGIIFTLDPMGNPIKENLEEHIDYLKTTLPYFKK
ncbi:TPA: NYN domain-containing protein [Campylobacter jejuni]|nr:NYN domain-containing protein [Campylobacter jejuni]HED8515593.1 NYN domain-containing protein [Campylobacter jejuni]